MSSGRNNKLVGQTGEYLVAAELSRRGLIATTFTGNVPHYDIIASDERGRHVSVQVKSAKLGSWQFSDLRKFCDIQFSGNRQVLGKLKPPPVRGLIVVFVKIGEGGEDRYYILKWQSLCKLLAEKHAAFLERNGGVRPKRWDSLHVALKEKMLLPYRDKWPTIEKGLR